MAHHEAQPRGHGESLGFQRLGPAAGALGLIGIIACIAMIAAPATREAMLGSYLYALIFWTVVTLGCFGLMVLHNLVRGSWSVPLLRMFEAGGSPVTLILMLLLFGPVLASMPTVYHWAHHDVDAIIAFKQPYLNVPFFIARLLFYFGVWVAISAYLRRSARRQEQSRDFKEEQRRSSWAAPSFIFFFVSITFAATDWAMSLDPHWYSTIWGLIFAVSAGLTGLSLVTVLFATNADKEPYQGIVSGKLLNDIGNMLFVLTMLWGYTNLSQLLIIWNANIPETASYYAARSHLGWNAVSLLVMVGQFFVPFFALLAPRTKKTPKVLARIAGWIFAIQIIDIYLKVVPMLPGHRNFLPTLFDFLALVAIGAIWFFAFGLQVRRSALLPGYDNRLQEAMSHAH